MGAFSTLLFKVAGLYGGGFPLTAAHYPTADRWVPARWFARAAAEVDAVETAQQLRAANAAAHGQALAEAGQKVEVQRLTRRIHRRAFPQVYRRRVRPREET